MNKLIVTVGLPFSGKTTWAKEQARKKGYPVVSMDAIRQSIHGQKMLDAAEGFIWIVSKIMVKSLFNAGHSVVILDGNHTTRIQRNNWVNAEWKREFKVFKTSLQTCIQRADDLNMKDSIPAIRAIADKFEPIADDEV